MTRSLSPLAGRGQGEGPLIRPSATFSPHAGRRNSRALQSLSMRKLLLILLLTALPAFAKEVLPFIDNDYAKALAQAKKRNVPIFVDAWAPW